MRRVAIPDNEIPSANPEDVILQYEKWIKRIAQRYTGYIEQTGAIDMDDLVQVGRIAILDAQKTFDPDAGCSFMGWSLNPIRNAMRKLMGYGNQKPQIVSLDEPLYDDSDQTLKDVIPDQDADDVDTTLIKTETRSEVSKQVRAALKRMKSEKQRTAVTLVWIDGKTRQAAADEMEMQNQSFCALENYGRCSLRKDEQLKRYVVSEFPFYLVGARRFSSTWTSAVEKAVIWRDIHIFGNGDNILNNDTDGGSECLVSETGRQ